MAARTRARRSAPPGRTTREAPRSVAGGSSTYRSRYVTVSVEAASSNGSSLRPALDQADVLGRRCECDASSAPRPSIFALSSRSPTTGSPSPSGDRAGAGGDVEDDVRGTRASIRSTRKRRQRGSWPRREAADVPVVGRAERREELAKPLCVRGDSGAGPSELFSQGWRCLKSWNGSRPSREGQTAPRRDAGRHPRRRGACRRACLPVRLPSRRRRRGLACPRRQWGAGHEPADGSRRRVDRRALRARGGGGGRRRSRRPPLAPACAAADGSAGQIKEAEDAARTLQRTIEPAPVSATRRTSTGSVRPRAGSSRRSARVVRRSPRE